MKVHISCTKGCKFEIDWTDPESLDYAKNFYKKYNEEHHEVMECVHDYHFEVVEK